MSGLACAAIPATRMPAPERTTGNATGMHSAQIGETLFVWSAADDVARALGPLGVRAAPAGRPWLITQVGTSFSAAMPPGTRILLDRGRHLIVDGLSEGTAGGDPTCWRAQPLEPGTVVVRPSDTTAERSDPQVDQLLSALSVDRCMGDITALVARGTRHSLSTGFADSAAWAVQRLSSLGYSAAVSPITVGAGHSLNVVADRVGTGTDVRGLVVVTAHLDSINLAGGTSALAPGADDNASGSAAVLELARVLAGVRSRHDLRLILFGGEEEGLFGSRQYVATLAPTDRARLAAVLNMDMIATRNTVQPGVLLEGAAVSTRQIDDLARAAATYTGLRVATSLSPFASDHVPFIDAGLPAVLAIEGSDSANHHIHSAQDVVAHLDLSLMTEILRMNLAALSGWLGHTAVRPVPAGPVVSRGPGLIDVFVGGVDSAVHHKAWDGLSWRPSVTGYESCGRPTSSSQPTASSVMTVRKVAHRRGPTSDSQ